ncbi:uncharacterized protein l(3)04053 [Venturia canescens]|uniref:uncharacterized protein l(3)04053 n=1 Tax=Venturia canescens TaxID=32260 RepID=UPI001C9C1CCA|nr:uncharacterized protein LOC122418058 [Venturia canescens]
MSNRRGTDGSSSPSVEPKDKNNFSLTSSNHSSRDNNLRSRDEIDNLTGSTAEGPSRESRRDENPFSFKHFLKKDTRPNYNLSGARPKVYSSARMSPSNVGSEVDSKYPCNPTELPDFVQDHLVIEQCYLNTEAAASGTATVPLVADIDNLPDFTINNAERRQAARCSRNDTEKPQISCDLPFDLTGGLERRKQRINPGSDNGACNNPPTGFPRPNQLPVRQNESARNIEAFPFDLPSSIAGSSLSDPLRPSDSPANENSINKSLPDFLNDGPIRNRVAGENDSSLVLPERTDNGHLALENERLREELKVARRHIAEKMRMIESLKAELSSRKEADQDETAHLEKAMEQVEVNLKRSTKRANSAESAVTLLKQEVKVLTEEVSILRSENRELRSLAGTGCSDYRFPGSDRRIKKLSDELRAAAMSAEGSLRQLMSGVNNLKVMATTLENIDRIEDRTKDYFPDFEEENAAGPAL